jgi:hypothetical protein
MMKTPASRGKRVIILHVGVENGWVKNGLLISAKNIKNCNADYHKDITGAVFEEWCEKQLFPNIPPGTVIVMDNAPSHSRLEGKDSLHINTKSRYYKFLTKEQNSYFARSKDKKSTFQMTTVKYGTFHTVFP